MSTIAGLLVVPFLIFNSTGFTGLYYTAFKNGVMQHISLAQICRQILSSESLLTFMGHVLRLATLSSETDQQGRLKSSISSKYAKAGFLKSGGANLRMQRHVGQTALKAEPLLT